jgi:hypothetical protein
LASYIAPVFWFKLALTAVAIGHDDEEVFGEAILRFLYGSYVVRKASSSMSMNFKST